MKHFVVVPGPGGKGVLVARGSGWHTAAWLETFKADGVDWRHWRCWEVQT